MPPRGPTIDRMTARAFRVPTDAPEADGTITWESTTLVVVEVEGGGHSGLGYTYSGSSVPAIVMEMLAPAIVGKNAFSIPQHWMAMVAAVRNLGGPGMCATAISAVDVALWDLKARLLELPLASLLGCQRTEVPIYGSGGFTSYTVDRLREQLASWIEQNGCRLVKMKIGTHPQDDIARIQAARSAIGEAQLFVDANGAYSRKQALWFAGQFPALGVTWFRNRCQATTLRGCGCFATALPREWISPPGNMAMIHSIPPHA